MIVFYALEVALVERLQKQKSEPVEVRFFARASCLKILNPGCILCNPAVETAGNAQLRLWAEAE